MELAPHQKRVVIEKEELDVKRTALEKFFQTDIYKKLHANEQYRLSRQFKAMTDYSNILDERISAF